MNGGIVVPSNTEGYGLHVDLSAKSFFYGSCVYNFLTPKKLKKPTKYINEK